MFPPEEGFGEPWFPIVPAQDGPAVGGWSDLCERFRFEGVGRIASASKLVCARAGHVRSAQDDLFCRVKRNVGGGSIYGDRLFGERPRLGYERAPRSKAR